MNLFRKKKAQPAPKITDSILKLREASTNLDKRHEMLSKKIDDAIKEAKRKSKLKDKRGAIFQLRCKKIYEKQIDQIFGKKTNIEIQILALEEAASNKEVITAMKEGATILKTTIKDLDVDKVDDVMNDINEAIDTADELNDVLSQPIGPTIDETELAAELEEMESEMADEELLTAPTIPENLTKVTTEQKQDSKKIITVPPKETPAEKTNTTTTKKISKEDQELRELAVSMGMT